MSPLCIHYPTVPYVGHSWENGAFNYVAHLDNSVLASSLVDALFPKLALEEAKVQGRMTSLVLSMDYKTIRDEGLLGAKNFLASFRVLLHVFIRCAAARPRDSAYRIVGESVRM